jgi:hypothetical protein
VKSSVSIALFFLLSGLFLTLMLGAIEHSKKLLAIAGVFLAGVVCIIVFLTPVQLPNFGWGDDDDEPTGLTIQSTTTSTLSTMTTMEGFTVDTHMTVTTGATGDQAF